MTRVLSTRPSEGAGDPDLSLASLSENNLPEALVPTSYRPPLLWP